MIPSLIRWLDSAKVCKLRITPSWIRCEAKELLSSFAGVLVNAGDSTKDVPQVDAVVLSKGNILPKNTITEKGIETIFSDHLYPGTQ